MNKSTIDSCIPFYTIQMLTIYTTQLFDEWFAAIKDKQSARRIQVRIDRAEDGHLGDHQSVGQGVWEMRLHHGPGFRVYFMWRGEEMLILLAGGDKSSQAKDIETAQQLARELKDQA
jgi:putative addiction module killer protein